MSINKSTVTEYKALPTKVLQFGSGVFLRGYFDWMLQQMNQQGVFNGAASMIKLTPRGDLSTYSEQDGVFQHIIRGVQDGAVVNKTETIVAIQEWIHPYNEWEAYLATAANESMSVVVSNSTEAGIRYEACDKPSGCPDSFPAKLCAWLEARFASFQTDVWVLPFELIEANGDQLREIVLRHASDWNIATECVAWIENHVHFVNTLVDRIVAAPSTDERAALINEGLTADALLNASEPYHILVLDADETELEAVLPLKTAGLNVVYTDELDVYRERKVKLLNGAHTSMLFLSYMRGNNTVEDSLNDEVIAKFLKTTLYDEVIPTIQLDRAELIAFADSVLERFRNPFLKHQLLSISLNSISKIQHRVLRSLHDAVAQGHELPQRLCLAFASFLYFYHGTWDGDRFVGQRGDDRYAIQDDAELLKRIADWWVGIDEGADLRPQLQHLCADADLWGFDLAAIDGFVDATFAYLDALSASGVDAALALIPSAH